MKDYVIVNSTSYQEFGRKMEELVEQGYVPLFNVVVTLTYRDGVAHDMYTQWFRLLR